MRNLGVDAVLVPPSSNQYGFSFDDVSIITAFTACAATIGNVGPGMELVGPSGNYAGLSNLSKIVLSFLMIIGRLELFAILVIFTPSFWKN